jgi:hypothetical protein
MDILRYCARRIEAPWLEYYLLSGIRRTRT